MAFDEASVLGKSLFSHGTLEETLEKRQSGLALPLRIIRRASRDYNDNSIAFVLTGTSSKLANFSPSIEFDASLREAKSSAKLFPPFILKYQDLYVPEYTKAKMGDMYKFVQYDQRTTD